MDISNIRIRANSPQEAQELIEFFRENGQNVNHMESFIRLHSPYTGYWGYYNATYITGNSKNIDAGNYYDSLIEYKASCPKECSKEVLPPRFAVKTGDPELSRLIQQKFFDNGIEWVNGESRPDHTDAEYIVFNYPESPWENKLGRGDKNSLSAYQEKDIPIISVADFFKLPFEKPKVVKKLNDKYSVEVGADSVVIRGPEYDGTVVSFAKIKEILAAIEKMKTAKILPKLWVVETPTKELYDFAFTKLRALVFYPGVIGTHRGETTVLGADLGGSGICHGKWEDWQEKKSYTFVPIEDISEYTAPIKITRLLPWEIKITKENVSAGCQSFEIEKFVELFKEIA